MNYYSFLEFLVASHLSAKHEASSVLLQPAQPVLIPRVSYISFGISEFHTSCPLTSVS